MTSTIAEKLKFSVDSAPSDGLAMARLLADGDRESRLRFAIEDMTIDLTRQKVTDDHLHLLLQYADDKHVMEKCHAMLDGETVNPSEQRPALHAHLRDPSQPMAQASVDAMAGHIDQLMEMGITDVVSIGIGGSDLGPAMAVAALSPYHQGPDIHFVSNLDPAHIGDCLAGLNPATTAVLVISKSFSTMETMANMHMAKRWFADHEQNASDRMLAITSMPDKAMDAGFDKDMILRFDAAIGGRYSIWSVVGFGLMLAIGPNAFRDFLRGAQSMDRHFCTAELSQNMPVMLALVGLWHHQVCGFATRAVLPYEQRLSRLPAYLQQLEMESNGKRVDMNGQDLPYPSGPVVWGEPGTNGQHAFYQLIHQGTAVVPCEFMVAREGHEASLDTHHRLLIADCLAQSEALMRGRTLEQARQLMIAQGLSGDELERQARHRVFPGNRPSTTLIYPRLSPFVLGQIIALYEHRVFAEGVILGINSFDQWGVELGKELARDMEQLLSGAASAADKDGSTQRLLDYIRTAQS